jgi:hypothetical protein
MTKNSRPTVTAWQQAFRDTQLEPKYAAGKSGRQFVRGSAVKNVLGWLATWADYGTGASAHPGTAALMVAAGLSENAVTWALQVGRELGWIVRTEHPKGSKRADVYALRIPKEVTSLSEASETTDVTSPSEVSQEVTSLSEKSDLTPSPPTVPDHSASKPARATSSSTDKQAPTKNSTDDPAAIWLAKQTGATVTACTAVIDQDTAAYADRTGEKVGNRPGFVQAAWERNPDTYRRLLAAAVPQRPRVTVNQCDNSDEHQQHEWTWGRNRFHCMGADA